MEENKEYSLVDIINTIKSFSNYLLRKWWLLILVIITGTILGIVFYHRQKPNYRATTTFVLEEKSGGSSLAGLASQFGINIGSGGGETLFAGDNILNIIKSKKVVQKVLLKKVGDTLSTKTLADLYLEFTGIKTSWRNRPLLANINFANIKGPLNEIQDSVLNSIQETIVRKNLSVEKTSKLGSIIQVQIAAENCSFARLVSLGLVDETAKLYYAIKTGTAEANIAQLQRRADSLLLLLNRKSFAAAANQPLDINPALRTAIVPSEIATRDKTVLATLYAEVTKNLEASKLLLSQQAPVIQILDQPQYLLDSNKKSIFFLIVVFSIGTLLIYTTISFIFFWINTNVKG